MKSIFQSKTFWGIIIAIVSQILKSKGIQVPSIDPDILSMCGAGLAAWGIRTGTKTIRPIFKK